MYLYLVHTANPKTTKLLLLFLLIFKPFPFIFLQMLMEGKKSIVSSFHFGILFYFGFNFLLQQFFSRFIRIFRLFLSRLLDMSIFFAVFVAKSHFLAPSVRFAAFLDCTRSIAMSTVLILSGIHTLCRIQIMISTWQLVDSLRFDRFFSDYFL